MALVQFPHNGGKINYPDNKKLFSNTKYIEALGIIIAEYSGNLVLTPWEDPVPKQYIYRTVMSSTELLSMLTPAEIRELDDGQKLNDDILKVWHIFKSAHEIDITKPLAKQALDVLESNSIIDAARRAEIEMGYPEEVN